MARARYDLCRMACSTVGTGSPLQLAGAVTSFNALPAGADGQTLRYAIVNGNNRETAEGVYTHAGTTITRTTLASTNGGSPISLTGSNCEVSFGPIIADLDETLIKGKHLIGWWGAGDVVRPTTDAADALAQEESATNKVNDEYISFPNGSTKYVGFSFRAPKSSDEAGSFDVELWWKEASGATAHVCRWQAEAQAQGDGDTIDSAWGTAVAADDTGSSGTRRSVLLASITPAGSWAAGDMVHFRLARLGGHANDTLDVAARYLGHALHGTINAGNDE